MERSRRPGEGRGSEGRNRHQGGTRRAAWPAQPRKEQSRGTRHLALPAASYCRRRRGYRGRRTPNPAPAGAPTQPAPRQRNRRHGLKAGAADVRLTSDVTPRRGGSGETAQEGVSGARAGRGSLTSGSGACARLPARPLAPSAAQVAARSSRWRPAAGCVERVRVRAF